MDFQKSFNSVKREELLSKLDCYGVRDISNNWFSSYLHKRTQFVTINTERSSNTLIRHGIPETSLLMSSVLFLLFINDMHKTITKGTLRHLADDANLLIAGKSVENYS